MLTPKLFTEIHQATLPYCGKLIHILSDARFRKFSSLHQTQSKPNPQDSVVYARFNLHSNDFYLGETGLEDNFSNESSHTMHKLSGT